VNALRHIIVGAITAVLSAVVERATQRYEAAAERAPHAEDEQKPAQDDGVE